MIAHHFASQIFFSLQRHAAPRCVRICIRFFVFALLCGPLTSWADEVLKGEHVRVSWLAPEAFSSSPHNTRLGIHFEVDDHWHVYWRNPGDSGTAPKFKLSGQGFEFGDVLWPTPTRLPVEHLTNIGYEGNIAYPVDAHLKEPQALDGDRVLITAELEWLVCKIECIPGFGTLSLSRPITQADEDQWQPATRTRLESFIDKVPAPAAQLPWHLEAYASPAGDTLTLQIEQDENLGAPNAFPLNGNYINARAPRTVSDEAGTQFIFQANPGAQTPEKTGFVVTNGDQSWHTGPLTIQPAPPAVPAQQPLLALFILALAGGIVLNLMPCVFPVLSIKVFGLLQTHGQTAHSRVREAIAYAGGVMLTFAVLGALFLLLRYAGTAVGWGFQLQSPWVVMGLAILFWVMGLGFLGVFEMGQRLMGMASSAGTGSSFSTGVLAVFVAAPCTGPFMGAALGASATLPAAAAMGIFVGLGAGLALPFVLLATVPALSRALPRPGPWMERLKEFFAFPLFATAIWLLWVFDRLGGSGAWLTGAITLLLLSLAIWLLRSQRKLMRIVALILAAAGIAWCGISIRQLANGTTHTAPAAQWQAYNPAALAAAKERGQAVFIDFTAAWCITCQVNKNLVLERNDVINAFNNNNVLLLRADWTRYDPVITQALAEFNRNSVPLYVYYHPDGNVVQLPEVLRSELILELFH